jgi:hypothetical protein
MKNTFFRMGNNVQASKDTLLDTLAGDSDKVDKDWRVNMYAQLSHQLHILGQKGEAVHFAEKAVKLDPSGPKNWLRLATAQDDQETMEDASQSFASAVLAAEDILKELDEKYDKGFDSESGGKGHRAEHQNLLQALAAKKSAAREMSRQTEPVTVSPPAEPVSVSPSAAFSAEIAAIKVEISQENYERAGELKNLKVQLTQAELSQIELPRYLQDGQSGGWKGRAAAAWATGSGRCNIPSRDIANLTRQEFYENYVDKGQPVILFGKKVFGGVATVEWAEEKFRQTWSQRNVRVVSSNMVVNDQQVGESSQQMALQDYLDSVRTKWRTHCIYSKKNSSQTLLNTSNSRHFSLGRRRRHASRGASSNETRARSFFSDQHTLVLTSMHTRTPGMQWSMAGSDGSYFRHRYTTDRSIRC